MKRLALALVLCGLVTNETAAADQTCKAKATQQKLAGKVLFDFVKQCETDAHMGCAYGLCRGGCGQNASRTC